MKTLNKSSLCLTVPHRRASRICGVDENVELRLEAEHEARGGQPNGVEALNLLYHVEVLAGQRDAAKAIHTEHERTTSQKTT